MYNQTTDPRESAFMAAAGRTFSDFYSTMHAKAIRLAARTGLNQQDAEEAVNDAFMKAYNGAGRFAGNSSIETWFYRICHNTATDFIRSTLRTPYFRSIDDTSFREFPTKPRRSLTDTEARVDAAIMRLDPKYQGVIRLHFYGNLTHEEISAELRIPLGTVKSRMTTAQNFLRQYIES